MTLDEMRVVAEECDYRQVPWAKAADINPTRLNLALRKHIELKADELVALEAALHSYIASRAERFTELLNEYAGDRSLAPASA